MASRPAKKQDAPPASGDAGGLAERLRAALPANGVTEQKMFGGICFMLDGNMVAGASRRGLLVRVGKVAHAEAVVRPGARPMEMRGKPMAGYIFVDPAVLDEATFASFLDLALAFVRTLPPKPAKEGRGAARSRR